MRSFLRFNQGILRLPLHLRLWVLTLVGANIVAPLFFITHLEAQLTLAAGVLSLGLMSALTGRFGFSPRRSVSSSEFPTRRKSFTPR